MPFVNETISEADKARYDPFHFVSPFTRNAPVEAWKWSIDRGRDVFLVSLGGQGGEHSEIPRIFALAWKGCVIRIETYCKEIGNVREGYELWWRLSRIVIPKALEPEADVAIALIKESLDASGYYFEREKVKAVHFDFIAPVTFA